MMLLLLSCQERSPDIPSRSRKKRQQGFYQLRATLIPDLPDLAP
ncbi:MAG: hypothetical protein WBZ24_10780 [Anaerolineales bacterium]